MPTTSSILVALTFVLSGLLLLTSRSVKSQLAPPLSSSLEQLARSPSSALLARNFLAQQSALVTNRPSKKVRLEQRSQGKALVSAEPHWSNTLEGSFRLDQYHTLEEIYAFLDSLARRYKHVKVFTIGKTFENRPIKAIEIINNATDPDYVWIDALTHAREWITATTLLYIIDQAIEPGSASRTSLAHNFLVVPVVNPDGYSYTWTNDRMWRKNRARWPESRCIGVDLNRNFDHSFGGEGSSNDPCSPLYSGAFAFSEPETLALADLLWSVKERVKFYLTLHSYNQLWACPYAHTKERSASLERHMRVLRAVQRAVREAEGVNYEIGPLSTSLYVGSGFGLDFAYDKCKIENSYLVELRDKGANGFILGPDQIMPTARETLRGLEAGLSAAVERAAG